MPDRDLVIHEEFVGMYEVSVTTGDNTGQAPYEFVHLWGERAGLRRCC